MADAVSHDHNFKNLIVEYPRRTLEFFAPDEVPARDDEASCVPVRQEQLKDRLGGRFRALDTPLLVEWADGRRDAVVFALEEESDWRTFSAHRLAHYCLDLSAMLDTDRVVPVVIFLRDAGRAPASLALGTERRSYLTFEYRRASSRRCPPIPGWTATTWSPGSTCRTCAAPGSAGSRSTGKPCAACWTWSPTPAGGRSTSSSSTSTRISPRMSDGATDSSIQRRAEPWQECSMRAREEGMQRGIEQGIERGMNRGRVEGERALLRRLLRRRFGALSPETVERVDQASARDLEAWADNVLDAGALDEVFDSNH